MKVGTGRITDFSKPGAQAGRETGLKRLQSKRGSGGVEVLDRTHGGQNTPVEVRLHEEVIIEGQGSIRLKKDGSPDLRFRNAPGRAEWEKIRRLEDK